MPHDKKSQELHVGDAVKFEGTIEKLEVGCSCTLTVKGEFGLLLTIPAYAVERTKEHESFGAKVEHAVGSALGEAFDSR